jgi:hypothetical protein
MASEETIIEEDVDGSIEEDVDDSIEEEEDDDGEVIDSDEVSFSSSSKVAAEVIDDFSIASRQRIRDEIDDQVAAFLARGGKISEVPANVTADPPKKPSPEYGGRQI